ncbi:MAG: plastocyanin/azurin family copper-binding protein [Bacteroidia bacterium]|jgi:azurin|nr:plastocyanin/azurin family copper-binding protein [Bacteroidia bacterium]
MKTQLIATASLVWLLTACGGGNNQSKTAEQTQQNATPQSYEFTVNAIGNTMADMAFDTKEIKVKAGSSVKVNLKNTGTDETMLHNIVFVKQGSEKEVAMEGLNLKDQNYFNPSNSNVVAGSGVTKPGETLSVSFTAPEPGVYSYICTYPGHWQKMMGTLIVE